jgi:hypothetical protein
MLKLRLSMPTQLDMKRLLPALIVGVFALGTVAYGVNHFIFEMANLSFRTDGEYAKLTSPGVVPPVTLPKDTYICNPPQKTPWVGCAIR